MANKPVIILVGGDKGGTGKTTVCRALTDYLAAHQTKVRVFDTENPKGDLKRFFPAADVIDFNSVRDQMRVFDGIETGTLTVVDIRAGVLSSMLRMLNDTHFLDDVRAGEMILVVLHVLGPSIASFNEIMDATAIIGGGARHMIVKNHANSTEFDLAKDPQYSEIFRIMAPGTINVPELTAIACETVQHEGVSFTQFVRGDTGASRTLRGYVRAWMEKVSGEFDRVGISALL